MTRTWDQLYETKVHSSGIPIWMGHRSGDPPSKIFWAPTREKIELFLNCDCDVQDFYKPCTLHRKAA